MDRAYTVSTVKLLQPRLTTLNEFPERADAFFLKEVVFDPVAKEKYLSRDLSREFRLFIERLDNLKVFDTLSIEESFRELIQELGIESKALIHPIRVALTGKTVGPGLFEVINHLGKERTKERLLRLAKGG
ncbi:MAG: hypothetical protein V1490_00745 [Candidatus Omnitrophota bacterium]